MRIEYTRAAAVTGARCVLARVFLINSDGRANTIGNAMRERKTIISFLSAIIFLFLAGSNPAFPVSLQDDPPRVVILTGADPSQPAVLVQIKTLRDTLGLATPKAAEVYLESLDGFRFGSEDLTPEFLALVKKKYSGQRVDLVIVVGNHAADFALRYHTQIWPGAPVLLSSVPEEWFYRNPLPDHFARVPFRIEIAKTLALAERLQPQASRLVVIGGTTDSDYSFIDQVIKAATKRRSQWTTVEDWQGMSLSEIKLRLSRLDDRVAVIYTTMYRDRDGHRYFPYQIVPGLVAASRAPIYAWYSTYLEGGVTAGAMYDFEENARMTADAALAIMRNGGRVDGLKFNPLPARCIANVTQMERYGLSIAALPADCELIDRPPSIFREHRDIVLTAITLLVVQLVTIVALLAQRRSRRLAEAEAVTRRGELARAARFATVGELSASIAHEVGQPLGAILSNADAAELLVSTQHFDASELAEILSDVKRDALRANDVVQRLRSLLQKQEIAFRQLSLDSTLSYTLTLIAPEARRRDITLETGLDAPDAEVLGDPVQIQQVVLNLALNGMDAMHDIEVENRVLTLASRQLEDGVEFSVTDRGTGIDSAVANRLFEPFYTTKPHGMGLGLSIVRSIVEAHRGRVHVASGNGMSTSFVVWLPRRASRHA